MDRSMNIKGGYPLEVDEIVFTDGAVLRNKIVMICGQFLIVEGERDREPSMYNLQSVEVLSCVREIRPSQKVTVSSRF